MDFTNRDRNQTATQQSSPAPSSALSQSAASRGKGRKFKGKSLLNYVYITLLFSVTIVIVSLVVSIILFDNKASEEEKFVDTNKYQAVFLNNGQVYFGHITELNKEFLNVGDIYYLRVNQQVQPGQQATQNDVSLVKLGCELHGPQDNMVVNRDQITFWENLKDDGQVSKAIAEYVKQNPNGQKCEQQPASSNSNNSGNNSNSSNSNNQ